MATAIAAKPDNSADAGLPIAVKNEETKVEPNTDVARFTTSTDIKLAQATTKRKSLSHSAHSLTGEN